MKAVVYGAGNIGRGFLGQLLYESGFHTVFIEVNRAVVDKINQDKRYPVKIVSNEKTEEQIIENISAVDGADHNAVSESIAQCDIMFTSVGVNVLPHKYSRFPASVLKLKTILYEQSACLLSPYGLFRRPLPYLPSPRSGQPVSASWARI